ncbi:MAG: methionyl-tRNA formyltransferase [Oscillospiraceae bacterium]|nr:methionyl-tRNA formyltransferase [Oscillospiraceae bacterium]
MRILFMGTPVFAQASLQALVEQHYEVIGAYTQPDKKQNRGMKKLPSPVKEYAITEGIPVFTPETLRSDEEVQRIGEMEPDLIVVVAYGKLLPEAILQIPKYGCINVHASLLPKYRGAAPIQWAVLNGEKETGVTIMHMVKELDAGDMIQWEKTEIGTDETAEVLHDRLMQMGAQLLVRTIPLIASGAAIRTPQDPAAFSYAPMLTRKLSPMDFQKSAAELHNQVRGLYPWPSATAMLGEKKLKILQTRLTGEHTEQQPGRIVDSTKEGIRVACGNGSVLLITRLQAEGGKKMSASEYLRGHALSPSDYFLGKQA